MKKTVWIARTAVCLALLIAIQFLTKSLGQLVTGSCVNLVLAIAAVIVLARLFRRLERRYQPKG